MGLFNTNLPYTNLHELNLDWLVKEMKKLREDFESIEAISPATSISPMDGTGAIGTSLKYAREDHQHPSDTTRASQSDMNSANARLDVDEANIQTLFNNKQKKLVAGSNIIITAHSDYDTISASGEIAVDYPSISNKPTLNGVTIVGNQTSEDYNIYHKLMLYSDGTKICSDSTLETELTYVQIKALLDNATNDVELWNGNYILRPEYTTTQGETSAIWFNATTSLADKTYLYRIAINSNNEVTNDEYELAQTSDIPAPYELPKASSDTLGGIKISYGLRIDPDTGETDVQPATSSTIGGVMIGNGLGIDTDGVLTNSNARRTKRNITNDLSNLSTAIAEQNLEKYGYTIGDYFVGASGYTYYLADMDTYYGGYDSYAVVGTHHCGIVVDTHSTCQWLSSESATSYSASTLHSFLTNTALPKIKTDIATLFGSWESHLISHTELDNSIGGWGTTWSGLANCYFSAMSEVQVYSSRVVGADGNQTATASKPLALFQKFRFNEIYGNTAVWLRSLSSASNACIASDTGNAAYASLPASRRASGLILFK